LKVTERDLRREVAAAYYRLVLARRLVEVAKSTLAEAQGFESRARKLNAGGEAARADVVKAQAEAAFLQQALQGAELDAETANHDLASYWTADVGAPLNVVDPFDAPLPQPEGAVLKRRLHAAARVSGCSTRSGWACAPTSATPARSCCRRLAELGVRHRCQPL